MTATITKPEIDFAALAAPGVRGLDPYQPGKPIEEVQREYGLTEVIKLASNENPLGPSPKAQAAVRALADKLALYPDGAGFELKNALAAHCGVPASGITLGDGSDNLMQLLAQAFLGPGRNAVMSQYAFAAYPIVVRAVGAELRVAPAQGPDGAMPYGHDLDAMLALIDADTRLVFVANPNNPTGTWTRRDELLQFLDAVPEGTLAVLDEAYFEYVDEADYPNGARLLERYPNLVVLRTFSKAYGLAGLRVGYALSHPAVADLMNRVRMPFNVNALAQAAALAALGDQDHVRKAVALNREQRAELERTFAAMNLTFIPSVGNFITIEVGDAAAVFDALLRRGVIVRPIANYGMPKHLRVTVGLPEENRRLVEALKQVSKLS